MQKKPKKLSVPFDLVIPLLAIYSKGTRQRTGQKCRDKHLSQSVFIIMNNFK